jgi:REP element-mobilizing transposase RayT
VIDRGDAWWFYETVMARPLRIDVEDGWYHVTARGIERKKIFFTERYYEHFLELLEEMTERYSVGVHSYVLLGNHYHLIIQTPFGNASQAMQWLNVSYSAWFNAKRNRVGHVFQGRFKSKLIDGGGSWLLLASVYLHLNPIRTSAMQLNKSQNSSESRGLKRPDKKEVQRRLERLRKYPWSSYPAYCGYRQKAEWLSTQNILARAGGRDAYRKYVRSYVARGDDPEVYETLKDRVAIGSAGFKEKAKRLITHVSEEQPQRQILKKRVSLETIAESVERLKGERWDEFNGRYGDWGRPLFLYLARRRSGATLKEIGDYAGGTGYKTVSKAICRFEERLKKDKALARMTKRLLDELSIVET